MSERLFLSVKDNFSIYFILWNGMELEQSDYGTLSTAFFFFFLKRTSLKFLFIELL